ncbi:MAG: M20/M25/M40 family metallo-hydrolase [Gemmatimonadota bacterium]|nr:M20/M25/M40 family metallo-hydrolase [Gemmatimonadota bacterium]
MAAIEADDAALLADMQQLIAWDTSFPPGAGYGAFAALIRNCLAGLGFEFRDVVVPEPLWRARGAQGERINLIAGRRSGRPVCSLYFHVDTAPPGDGWTRPPLACTREGDRLYGRGAADMKGTIAAVLAALRAASTSSVTLAYDPVLLLCTDEEGGLYPGIRYLAEQRLIEGHLLSFNGGAAPRIWAGCFGSFDLLIRIGGRAAHSGEPERGINAIECAVPVLQALAGLKIAVEARQSALPPPPYRDGRKLTGQLTVAAIHGGEKGSAVPGQVELLVNRRYAPEESFDRALEELQATVREAAGATRATGVQFELLGHLAPVSDPVGPHWPRWQAALSAGFGFALDSFRAWGASSSSDMGWVQRAGVQEILLGGLGRPDNNVHAADEYTTMNDLKALARSVLAYLAADFASPLIPERSA